MKVSYRICTWTSAVNFLAAVFCFTIEAAAQTFTSSNLPIVIINTNGQTIVNEPKITVDMRIIYNGEGKRNAVTDTVNHYKGKVGIEIRGSSSQMFPKKQYGFETRDHSGEDSAVSLFGMPSEADWILSAQYNDKSLMRDALTYSLSNAMGRYASRSRYTEVVINGEYLGVYMLFEKIKRDKNRVNISKLDSTGVTGDALTGGYIIKIDKLDGSGNDGWYSNFAPKPGSEFKVLYQYHYPKPEDITAGQKTYIKNAVLTYEAIMYSPTYADSVNGYSKYFDVPSMVDNFLVNEMTRNVDAYRLSTFMYKDKDSKNPKFFFGPVWDYNHGYGNCDYYEASKIQGWQLDYQSTNPNFITGDMFQPPFWWKKVFDDTLFRQKTAARWQTLRASVLSLPKIYTFIDSIAALINEAQQRNFTKWPILNTYVWPNAYIGGTYANEVNYLKMWIMYRLDWMDQQLVGRTLSTEKIDRNVPQTFSLEQNFPNPFNPATVIKFSAASIHDRNAAGQGDRITLRVFNLLGQQVAVLFDGIAHSGVQYSVPFNAQHLPSGVYFARLEGGGETRLIKMQLLR